MKQKQIFLIATIALIIILGISIISAFGFIKGFGLLKQGLTEQEIKELQEQNKEIQKAIENGDYSTWKSLMEQRIEKMKQQLTEENFNRLRENYQKIKEKNNGEKGFMKEMKKGYNLRIKNRFSKNN